MLRLPRGHRVPARTDRPAGGRAVRHALTLPQTKENVMALSIGEHEYAAWRLRGPLDVAALRRRHNALSVGLSIVDLGGSGEPVVLTEICRSLARDHRPVTAGHSTLFQVGADDHVLVVAHAGEGTGGLVAGELGRALLDGHHGRPVAEMRSQAFAYIDVPGVNTHVGSLVAEVEGGDWSGVAAQLKAAPAEAVDFLVAGTAAVVGRDLGECEITVDIGKGPDLPGTDSLTRLAIGWSPDEPLADLARGLRDGGAGEPGPAEVLISIGQDVAFTVGSLRAEPVELPARAAGHRLAVRLRLRPNGVRIRIDFDTRHRDREGALRLARRLWTVWTTSTPELPIRVLTGLTALERQQVLVDWAGQDEPYPSDSCLHELIEAAAHRNPATVAVSCGPVAVTYAELNDWANRAAAHLRALEVRPDTVVGVVAARSVEAVVGMLAILKAGGAFLPLDPQSPAERLRYQMDDTGAVVVLAARDHIASMAAAIPKATVVSLSDFQEGTDGVPDVPAGCRPDHLAYVIYTSGSTGRPKGVAVSHRNIVHSNHARHVHDEFPERVLITNPLTFDGSASGLYWALTEGGTVLIPTDQELLDLKAGSDLIRATRATHLHTIASVYSVLLDYGHESTLRLVNVGGEVLPPSLVARHFAVNPGASLFNDYGPTEATVWASTHRCGVGDGLGVVVPVGRPVSNCRVFVLDGDLVPVLPGLVGEIFIGGVGVARGYVGRGGLTAERFVPDPFGGGGRLYRTGDRGRHRVDGVVEFLGRVDKQVKVRGFRVELGEIENAIQRSPDVTEAVVLAENDGVNECRLVAHVVLRDPDARSVLREHLAQVLPNYMCPHEFVWHKRLPRNHNGKVDAAALSSAHAKRAIRQQDGTSVDQLALADVDALLRELS
ncbi:amino acid adenylation domain-containing protein [Actinocrispum sp. NPDC049592]|uniref:amino acid adenylation domain-containing protein n=1 Tax=Actinocrispum sp. NPDC049592 TaxID=3154835 RepID=UPI0034187421